MIAVPTRTIRWQSPAILLVVITIGVVWGLLRGGDGIDVRTVPATYQDLNQRLTTNGTVMPTNEFQARAFWPGVISKVYVELGDKVKPGQLLVSMKDPFAISRMTAANAALQGWKLSVQNIHDGGSQEDRLDLQGNLAHAQLEQAQAQKALEALQKLRQQGAASHAEVDAATERLKAANASVETLSQKKTQPYTEADIRNADAHLADAQANVDSAKVQFNNANMTSPIAGTVYSISVVPYDWVPVGTDLIRVADLNQVEVRAYFDEPEIGKLLAGQAVTVTWDGRPGRTWHGHIKQAPIAAMALGPRSVGECVIAVDDAREDLLPNTNVVVTATVQQRTHVLSIPREALHTEGRRSYVYRLVNSRLQRVQVDTGIVSLERAEITRGLGENDLVVLNAMDNRELRDGMQVRNASPTLTGQ